MIEQGSPPTAPKLSVVESSALPLPINETMEWLETDGRGGFAMGTTSGLATRRYHGLLISATTPPTGRMMLVNGVEVHVTAATGTWPLSSQRYVPGVISPDGQQNIESFLAEPWPQWIFLLPDGTRLRHEIVIAAHSAEVVLSWTLLGTPQAAPVTLTVRPFLTGRDHHALHHENAAFPFTPRRPSAERLVFPGYPSVPEVVIDSNGRYDHDPQWYRQVLYAEELARGMEAQEDLAAPGTLTFDLDDGEAIMILAAGPAASGEEAPAARAQRLRHQEQLRREALGSPLHRAAAAYLVQRGEGASIVAGYPWFTDWGRDTFIALRGLCLAPGRLAVAGAILTEWAGVVSGGMVPNRFPDGSGPPEYNAVDASLWYVVAVYEFLQASGASPLRPQLVAAVETILLGHERGTRHAIGMTNDALLAAGVPGLQLTWMDARVGDHVVTPRSGKAVEIQALWLNALWIGAQIATPSAEHWRLLFQRGQLSFGDRFWNDERQCLYDVVDCEHRAGDVDPSLRPNQIFAVGGLPVSLLAGARAEAVVAAVEQHLLTPAGLRTLAPGAPGYAPCYRGDMAQRDASYHQGTVWPWLMGAFVEAWARVRGDGSAVWRQASERFLVPLRHRLRVAGVGHLSEIADATAPHAARGCPFQAWSVGELLRLEILAARHTVP